MLAFYTKVEPIAYSKEWTGANVDCVLTGWGSLDVYRKGPNPNGLQEIHLSTISYEDCHNKFDFITANNLCTITGEGKGACSGDSGGPLVDKHVQVAVITAVNEKGCGTGQPDFYSRTSAFYDWIQQNTVVNGAECATGNSDVSVNTISSGNPCNLDNHSDSGKPSSSGNPLSAVLNWLLQIKL